MRAGMTTVIIPAGNAPELSEIPEHVMAKVTIKPVRTMAEVLALALARPPKSASAGANTDADASAKATAKVGPKVSPKLGAKTSPRPSPKTGNVKGGDKESARVAPSSSATASRRRPRAGTGKSLSVVGRRGVAAG
jgi:hypothetical protein